MDEIRQLVLIDLLKKYALDNYEKGYDTFVECFGDDEWREMCEDHNWDPLKIRRHMARLVDVWQDRRDDARNS